MSARRRRARRRPRFAIPSARERRRRHPPPPARSARCRPAERIAALDILRGVALLGIFIMNMPGFGALAVRAAGDRPGPLDGSSPPARRCSSPASSTCCSALLFGIGFTLQLGRLEGARGPARGAPRVSTRAGSPCCWRSACCMPCCSGRATCCRLRGARLRPARVARCTGPGPARAARACLLFPAAADGCAPLLLSMETETLAVFEYQELEPPTPSPTAAAASSTPCARRRASSPGATPRRSASSATPPSTCRWPPASWLGFLVGRRGWVEQLPTLRDAICGRAVRRCAGLSAARIAWPIAWSDRAPTAPASRAALARTSAAPR